MRGRLTNRFAGIRSLAPSFAIGLVVAFVTGCVTPQNGGPASLAAGFQKLGPKVDPTEAGLLAERAFSASQELAREYAVVRPAVLHNCLVNVGLKRRGLCYHWSEDLRARLLLIDVRTLELHRGVARMATYREHNAVVVTAAGAPFSSGIVLDPWKDGGRLQWTDVSAAKRPWEPAPRSDP